MKKMLYLVGLMVLVVVGSDNVYAKNKANLSLVGPTEVMIGETFEVILSLDSYEHQDGVAAVGGNYLIDEEIVEIIGTESLAIFNISYNKKIMCGFSTSLDTRIKTKSADLFKLVLRVRDNVEDEMIEIGTDDIEISAGNPRADILPANNPSLVIKVVREEEISNSDKEDELKEDNSSKIEEVSGNREQVNNTTVGQDKKDNSLSLDSITKEEVLKAEEKTEELKDIKEQAKTGTKTNNVKKKSEVKKNKSAKKVKKVETENLAEKPEQEKVLEETVREMVDLLNSIFQIFRIDMENSNWALSFLELPVMIEEERL